jgi:hypothetical protein
MNTRQRSRSNKLQSDTESIASSVVSAASAESRSPLPDNIQKALAELLESNGGIKTFHGAKQKLARLCDAEFEKDPSCVFGPRRDPIRRRLQLKVLKWQKKADTGVYASEILNKYGVKSWENRQRQGRATTRNNSLPLTPPSDSSGSDSSSSTTDSTSCGGSRVPSARNVQSPPPKQIVFEREGKPSEESSPLISPQATQARKTKQNMSEDSPRGHAGYANIPIGADVIQANLDCPEKNRELYLFPVSELNGIVPDVVYEGYIVMFRIDDLRLVYDFPNTDYFKCQVIGGKGGNQLLITLNSWPYTLLHNDDRKHICSRLPVACSDAIDVSRNDFIKNKSTRELKQLVLRFPKHFQLSASLLDSKAGSDEICKMHIIPIKYSHPTMPDILVYDPKNPATGHKVVKAQNVVHWAAFEVARYDVPAKEKGEVKQISNLSQAAQLAAHVGW